MRYEHEPRREPAGARVVGRRATAGRAAVVLAAILAAAPACGGDSAPSAPREAALEVTAVVPAGGRVGGGTPVTVMGLGFRAGATVTIDGVAATSVHVVNGVSITAVAPPARGPGLVAVAVTNADGRRVELPLGFLYVPDADGPAGPWDY